MISIIPLLAADCEDVAELNMHSKQVTVLDLSNKNLKDIEFIKDYPNLEELDLSENPFVSIAPLVNLKNLRRLNLEDCCNIKDLELLGRITSLQNLNMSAIYTNQEINYPPLDFIRSLKELEEVNISHNFYMYKINPLAILPKLRILHLKTGYPECIKDWFSLNHFFTLKELTIFKEDIKRFPHLEGVTIRFA